MKRKTGWILGGTAAVALSVAAVAAMAQGWGYGPGYGPQGGWNQQGGNWGPQGMNRPMMGPGMMQGGQGFGPGMMGQGPGMMQGGPGMQPGGAMFAGRLARFCGTNEGMITGFMLARRENRLGIGEAQTEAWNNLKAAVKTGEEKLRTACDAVGSAKTAPERMAALDTTLGAASEAVKAVRPAVDGLYATLNDQQKQMVDQMGQGRHGKWGRHGMKHRQMGWGGPGMNQGQWGGPGNCPMGGQGPWWGGAEGNAPAGNPPAPDAAAPQAN